MESVLPIVQDFQPSVETIQEEDCDTILLYLPGFKKEQLRVQLTTTRNLIVSGECRLEQQNVMSRFRKEFPLSMNVEAKKITAKFEGSILFIRQPKLITPSGNQKTAPNPPIESAMPQKPVNEPQPERKIQEQAEKISKQLEQLNEKVKQELGSNKAVPNKPLGEKMDQKLNLNDLKKNPDQLAMKKDKSESEWASEREKSDIVGGDARMAGNASEKQVGDAIDSAMKKEGEADDGGRKTLDNYRRSVDGLATKLRKPMKVMNILVVVLMALVFGMYVTNSLKSWKTEETAGM